MLEGYERQLNQNKSGEEPSGFGLPKDNNTGLGPSTTGFAVTAGHGREAGKTHSNGGPGGRKSDVNDNEGIPGGGQEAPMPQKRNRHSHNHHDRQHGYGDDPDNGDGRDYGDGRDHDHDHRHKIGVDGGMKNKSGIDDSQLRPSSETSRCSTSADSVRPSEKNVQRGATHGNQNSTSTSNNGTELIGDTETDRSTLVIAAAGSRGTTASCEQTTVASLAPGSGNSSEKTADGATTGVETATSRFDRFDQPIEKTGSALTDDDGGCSTEGGEGDIGVGFSGIGERRREEPDGSNPTGGGCISSDRHHHTGNNNSAGGEGGGGGGGRIGDGGSSVSTKKRVSFRPEGTLKKHQRLSTCADVDASTIHIGSSHSASFPSCDEGGGPRPPLASGIGDKGDDDHHGRDVSYCAVADSSAASSSTPTTPSNSRMAGKGTGEETIATAAVGSDGGCSGGAPALGTIPPSVADEKVDWYKSSKLSAARKNGHSGDGGIAI